MPVSRTPPPPSRLPSPALPPSFSQDTTFPLSSQRISSSRKLEISRKGRSVCSISNCSSFRPRVHCIYRTSKDNIELHVACKDIAGLFERNSLASILRGAVLSPALKADAHFSSTLSNVSPLFKLPVDAVQRGRDHGKLSHPVAIAVASSSGASAALLSWLGKTFLVLE